MATRVGVLLLTCSVALGCGGDAIPPSAAAGTPGPTLIGAAHCAATFSPDAALLEATELAAARWSVATGCEVVVAEGGVPVELAATIPRPDGSEAPGATSAERDLVRINMRVGKAQRERTVMHELGHALGGDHTASDGVLSGAKGGRDVIDAEALATVCSRLPCTVRNAESP